MPEGLATLSKEVLRAIRVAEAHDAVHEIRYLGSTPESGAEMVEISMKVGLPCAWVAAGQSPHGVRSLEPVTFLFPVGFPLLPPEIRLRADFNRTLPHIQPSYPWYLPEPCLCEGTLGEFLQQKGFAGVLNQLMEWLDKAAMGTLMDQQQGWEPVRRDYLLDRVVADTAHLRSVINRKAGRACFSARWMLKHHGKENYFNLEVTPQIEYVNAKNFADFFAKDESKNTASKTLSILVWPDENVIADQYLPETVCDLPSLMERADQYGCKRSFQDFLDWMKTCLAGCKKGGSAPILVMLVARRPVKVIGTDSELEICPYLFSVSAPVMVPKGEPVVVFPVGLHHSISRSLFSQMSGVPFFAATPRWTLAGCGSLGSKIALHLTRAGLAPAAVIDRSCLSPHNASRHGLFPATPGVIDFSLNSKAEALASAIRGLNSTAEPWDQNLVAMVADSSKIAKLLPESGWGIVNTTASLAVREALVKMRQVASIPRTLETTLFAQGRVGLLSVEGPGGNPSCLDLITEAYVQMVEDGTIKGLVFAPGNGPQQQPIGEGCGSLTMVMTDSRLSMFAASMAEGITGWLSTTLPPSGGSLNLGVLGADGMGLSWKRTDVSPFVVVPAEGESEWQVRISPRAIEKIKEEVSNWPNVETGGILVGRISEVSKVFLVADVLPAPTDSIRSRFEFVLGKVGVREQLSSYSKACNFSLFCLGTWHSHLQSSGPSGRDMATADTIAIARLAPSILLIHTPSGFRAVLAEQS